MKYNIFYFFIGLLFPFVVISYSKNEKQLDTNRKYSNIKFSNKSLQDLIVNIDDNILTIYKNQFENIFSELDKYLTNANTNFFMNVIDNHVDKLKNENSFIEKEYSFYDNIDTEQSKENKKIAKLKKKVQNIIESSNDFFRKKNNTGLFIITDSFNEIEQKELLELVNSKLNKKHKIKYYIFSFTNVTFLKK